MACQGSADRFRGVAIQQRIQGSDVRTHVRTPFRPEDSRIRPKYEGVAYTMMKEVAERRINVSGVIPGGLPTEYLVAGDGPPLVLLHGVGDSAYTWQYVMPALALTHRVYAPSMPGFGGSARPRVDYSPEFFTAFAFRFLDALRIGRTGLVGNSLGGMIAMRMALSRPERVETLTIVDSAGLGRGISPLMRLLTVPGIGKMVTVWNKTAVGARQWALQMAAHLFAHPTRAPKEWVRELSWMAQTPGYLEATVATVRGGSTIKGQRKRLILLDELPYLEMPVLVVWGKKDRVVPKRHARAAVERLPNGRLSLVKDCGHLPHMEQPEHFAVTLQEFLVEATSLPLARAR